MYIVYVVVWDQTKFCAQTILCVFTCDLDGSKGADRLIFEGGVEDLRNKFPAKPLQ